MKKILAILMLLVPSGAWAVSDWLGRLVPEVHELPTQSCSHALENGLDYSDRYAPFMPSDGFEMPTLVASAPPTELPTIHTMDGDVAPPPIETRPHQLPPPFLEGDLVDIWKVGDVFRRAAVGERVRVTFLGSTHVASGQWTDHIRSVLQRRYGDAGHGLVLPNADRTDLNLCLSDDWQHVGTRRGITDDLIGLGLALSSDQESDFAWVETGTNQVVDRIRVFGLMQPGGGHLRVILDADTEMKIPTMSNEVSLMQAHIEVPWGAHRLTLSPQGDGPVRLLGVSAETIGSGVVVDSIGRHDHRAHEFTSLDSSLRTELLQVLDPDLIVLAYGTEEAADSALDMDSWTEQVRDQLRAVRQAAPQASCIVVGPPDRGIRDRNAPKIWDRTELIADVQRKVAPEFGCVFWDWQQATGGAGSMIVWRAYDPPLAASDLIHFTPAGYTVSAEQFVASLDEAMNLEIIHP